MLLVSSVSTVKQIFFTYFIYSFYFANCLILVMVGELKHARCASLEQLAGKQALVQGETITKMISTLTIPAWTLALALMLMAREEALDGQKMQITQSTCFVRS